MGAITGIIPLGMDTGDSKDRHKRSRAYGKSRTIASILIVITVAAVVVYYVVSRQVVTPPQPSAQNGESDEHMISGIPWFQQKENRWDGPACAQMVLTYHGKSPEQGELADQMNTSEEKGTTFDNMHVPFDERGFKTRSLGENENFNDAKGKLQKEIDRDLPVIIYIKQGESDSDGKFIVVIGYNKTGIRYHDPDDGEDLFLTYEDLRDIWSEKWWALIAYKD